MTMRLRLHDQQVSESEADIRRAVRRMLTACDVHEPPTPIDRLLHYSRLSVEEREAIQPSEVVAFFRRAKARVRTASERLWTKVGQKIRGLLDLQSRHIAVDTTLHPRRQEFLVHHEVGHGLLPWHRDLFVATSEWDLNLGIRSKFEAEANYFAGHSIFQLDDMARVQRGRRLRIAELAGLAARYGASLTATARQYVAIQDIPVALLVGRAVGAVGQRSIRFSYGVANATFVAQFGFEFLGDGFKAEEAPSAVLNLRACEPVVAELAITDINGDSAVLSAETIYNTYCTLTLVHPTRKRASFFGWQKIPHPATSSRP